jgi:hypothetical protein
VWNDPTKDAVSYLYAPSDAYHHESSVGTFLNACVFFETFTGQSSVGITLADMLPYCSDLNTALTDADVAYCEAKAHQAMIAYYGAGNLPHLGMSPLEWLAIYEVGNPRTAKTWTLTSNDVFLSQTVSSAITATKKQAWLSVSVNSSNPSNQIITATIDPTSFASGEQKYYDTIVVHVGNGIADRSLPVCAWVRSPSTIASITVTPNAAAGSIGQTIQFSAKAFDQYDQAFSPQPTFSWTAEGGTITGSALLTVTSCSGTFKITASAASVSGNATVVVKMLSTARSATASVSSLESGHTASALNDGVIAGYPADASKEWSSNGEKAGAWAQLTWPTAVTIDSIALWDRPNTTDQVTSATLTFSDGSSLAVGSLPNNASTPWSQKFAAKTVTWAKVTVNTVLAGTVNAGLAEFETFNTTACAGTEVLGHATINDVSRLQLGAIAKGILVNAPLNESWSLDLYTLNGTKISTIVGRGSELVAPTALKNKKGFVVALLKSATATLSETVLCK